MTCPQLMSVKTVAERLAYSRSKVYELIQSGDLPATRIGADIRIREDVLAKYVQEHTIFTGKDAARLADGRRRANRRPA